MIVCSVNEVKKIFGGSTIFENISFEIKEGDRIGLVGRNGSGKTTLFRLICGEDTPDNGKIHWKKGTKIGYLTQIPDSYESFNTREVLKTAFANLIQLEEKMKQKELLMGQELGEIALKKLMFEYGNIQDQFTREGGYEIEADIERIANGLNIGGLMDKPFSALSGGEKTKVVLGLQLLKKPDLLLLDEPTNHLDLNAVEWLSNFLQGYDGAVVVVSHDRYFLDEVVTKVFDLEDGKISFYQTNFSGFVKEKEERLLREFQAYEEEQKKIKKMKEAIKRLRDWANRANPPNEGLHKRARNMERALERMEKRNRPILNRKKMNLHMKAADRSGKDVIILRDVSKCFDGQEIFANVNMQVQYQQRVAIIGENGTGKSTLIKLILKQLQPDEGEVRLGSNVKIGYLSQQIFSSSHEDWTIMEAFRNNVRVTEGEARHILAKFLFYGHQVFQEVSQLSGGEKMRLRLAQLMYQDINLLVLDEPTNHLDIESREVLEETLESFKGTILAVSHDRYFLDKLFDEIYWIEERKVHRFAGNYSWAKEKMGEFRQHHEEIQRKEKDFIENKGKQSEQEINIEELELLEQRIAILEDELVIIRDLTLLQQKYKEKEDLEKRWEELYEQMG